MAARVNQGLTYANRDQRSVERTDGMMDWDLRHGRWEDALASIETVDAVIVDPPYSARTHEGHDAGASLANRAGAGWERSDGGVDVFRPRREITYQSWDREQVNAFVDSWAPRCRGWFVAFSDSDLCREWREAFEAHGLTGFQPLPVLIPGMTVRMCGDGPSSWAVYLNVARPKTLAKWGTLSGGYYEDDGQPSVVLPPVLWYRGGQGERKHIGGKPIWLMRAIVRDYTKPGDLICDPCAGAGTTLLAALMEGRPAIGAEVDEETHATGLAWLQAGYTPDIFSNQAVMVCADCGGRFTIKAFALDRTSPRNRQPHCRRCRARWEISEHGAWRRFAVFLHKEEPDTRRLWTEERFLAMWAKAEGRCELCGAGLAEWQTSGYRMDRIDNDRPHIPGNCRLLCWPCNEHKSSGSPISKDEEIAMWVKRYGRGRVPWGKIRPEKGYKPAELPDVEQYRVGAPPAEQLTLLGGTR